MMTIPYNGSSFVYTASTPTAKTGAVNALLVDYAEGSIDDKFITHQVIGFGPFFKGPIGGGSGRTYSFDVLIEGATETLLGTALETWKGKNISAGTVDYVVAGRTESLSDMHLTSVVEVEKTKASATLRLTFTQGSMG